MRARIGKISSNFLEREAPYAVLLPADYSTSKLTYPVLYLLHGLFGQYNNWLELTNVEELSKELPLIIVMPDGRDGWYCDSATLAAEKYESFLIAELFPTIEKSYRTIAERHARAIAGLSMGGYGAFKFAVKRPDLFSFAASFSGAFDAPERSDDTAGFDWDTLRPSILRAFGDQNSTTRTQNDLFKLCEGLSPEAIRQLPYFYFDCGTGDGFLDANFRLKKSFERLAVAHDFAPIEGGHDWDYWSARLPKLLSLATERLLGPQNRV